ncbi:hypothetical protein [Acidocella sp.]|uniref:hypothetical protein n=1 Tax=Acidocella sp. TaxID=50710 RepID=UPI002634BF8F|nr:hypothetical protein [Acidocella sp.]
MATLGVVTISVAQARDLLQRRSPAARRNVNAVRAYALAMRERRWVLNGVPLIISNTGQLRDGYQRLLACLEAQTPFETFLIRAAGPHQAGECPPPVTCGHESISPALAEQYLALSAPGKRLSLARVASLATDLAQGREAFDAQPICFARSGRLLRGRHRLHAVIQAGGAARVAVIRGLDEAAAETYERCTTRRSQIAGANQFGDVALAAAMANLLWRHEQKTLAMPRAKANAVEISQIIAEHPRLLELRGFARRTIRYGRASVMGYAAYVMEREDAALAARFIAILEDTAPRRAGHPLLALCMKLQAQRRRKTPQAEQLATLLAGWTRFKARQTRVAADEVFRNQPGARAL